MLLLVIFAILIAAIIARMWTVAKQRGTLRPFINRLIIASFLGILVLLVVFQKIHWIGAAIGFLLLALKQIFLLAVRFFPLLTQIYQHRSSNQSNEPSKPSATSTMSVNDAYKVLGIERGATRQDVIDAHRRLMAKLHPDRGGNDHLAAQINEAKEVLLNTLND